MTSKADKANEAAGEEQAPRVFPPYYNPRSISERFRIGDGQTADWGQFARGRYVPATYDQEQSVRAALAAYGRDKPDRWSGDDMKKMWTCPKCGLTTGNQDVREDHDRFDLH